MRIGISTILPRIKAGACRLARRAPAAPPSLSPVDVLSVGDGADERNPHPRPGKRARRSRRRRKRGSGEQIPVAPSGSVQPEWSIAAFPVAPAPGLTRFHDLDLPLDLMHGIADLGFEYCTPIQAAVLPDAIAGRNITGKAQTGTGKTAAFLISIFTRALHRAGDSAVGQPRALILAPTRELVVQIASDATALGAYLPFGCVAVYGGMDFDKQAAQLKAGPVMLVAATPGRLLDFANRKILDLSAVEYLVIDEADRMLDMGFIPDVRRIVRMTPARERRQTLFFSATLTDDVNRLVAQWVPDPVRVEIEPEQVAVETVEQIVYVVRAEDKLTVLFNLIQRDPSRKLLVFGNRRDATERVYEQLVRLGVQAELLSGAVNQKKRMRVLDDFRAGRLNVVVATDVAGRGIHVDRIDYVVNYDLPYEPTDYVHRIGRTGRAGETGKAISFACEDESFIIPDIESYIHRNLPCCQPEDDLLAPLPPMKPGSNRPPRAGVSGRDSGRRSGGRRGPVARSRRTGRSARRAG